MSELNKDEIFKQVLEAIDKPLAKDYIYGLIDKDWWESLLEDFNSGSVQFENLSLDQSHLIDSSSEVLYISDDYKFYPLKSSVQTASVVFIPLSEHRQLERIIEISIPIFRKCILEPNSQNLYIDLFPPCFSVYSGSNSNNPSHVLACDRTTLTEDLYNKITEVLQINPIPDSLTINCIGEDATFNFDRPTEIQTIEEAGYHMANSLVVKYLEDTNGLDWTNEAPDYSNLATDNDSGLADPIFDFNNDPFESEDNAFQISREASPSNALTLESSIVPYNNSNGQGERGVVGLSNLGNTCFMNSALQCLSNTHILTDYFLQNSHMLEINKNNPLGMGGIVAEAYGKLIHEIWTQGKSVISPARFKAIIGKFAPQFLGYQQHDSQEFLAFLFDGLHEDLNRIKDKPYIDLPNSDGRPDAQVAEERWTLHKRRNDSIIVDLFQGMYKSTLLCPTCDHISVTFDPFMYLTLPLPIVQKTDLQFIFVPHIQSTTGYKTNVKMHLTLPSSTSIYELKTIIATVLKIDYRQLYVSDIYQNKVHETLTDHNIVSSIKSSDEIYVYEKAPLVTHAKIVSFYLIHAFAKKSNNSLNFFGVPSLISMDSNQASSLSTIYENVLESIQRYTTYDLEQIKDLFEDLNPSPKQDTDSPPIHLNGDSASTNEPGSSETTSVAVESEQQSSDSNVPFAPKLPFQLKKQEEESQYMRYLSRQFTFDKLQDIVSQQAQITTSDDSLPSVPLFKNETTIIALWEPLAMRQVFGHKSIVEQISGKPGPKLLLPGEQSLEQWAHFDHLRPDHFEGVQLPKNVDLIIPRHLQRGLSVTFTSPSDDNTETESLPPASLSNEEPSPQIDPETNHQNPLLTTSNSGINSSHNQPRKRTKHISLEDCIDEFLKEEKLGQHDLWYCPKCKEHQQATKKFDLWSLPGILVVHLKRFSQARYLRDKIDALIDFPITDLDLTDYVQSFRLNPDQPRLIYDLYAVSNHFGGLGGGHYTAYAKNFEQDQWYCFDDSRVRPVEPDEVKTSAAYLLFYQLRGFNPPTFPTLKSLDGSSPVFNTTVTLNPTLVSTMSVSRDNSSPIPPHVNSDLMSISDNSPMDPNLEPL